MNKLFLMMASVFLFACSNGQNTKFKLDPQQFSDQLNATENPILIDVRTPQEYLGGHLHNAINIDWNGENFSEKVAKFPKDNPLFVYCLSGGRSGSAAAMMRESGFKQVFEMEGGMIKWRAAGLSESTDTKASQGMSMQEYNQMVVSNPVLLVDFYAEWCAPCKKMKPYLMELEQELSNKVKIVRIDADKNTELLKQLHVDALPVLMLYEKGTLQWQNQGFVEKQIVLEHLPK